MATATSVLEKFIKAQLQGMSEVTDAVGDHIYNSIALPGYPYLVYKLIPLKDNYGQARTSIQYNYQIQIKFVSKLPLPDSIDTAVDAILEYFRTSRTFDYLDKRISVWHQQPITYETKGAVTGEYILNRGGLYRASVS